MSRQKQDHEMALGQAAVLAIALGLLGWAGLIGSALWIWRHLR